MNYDFVVRFPWFECSSWAFSHEAVSVNATPARIVAGDDDLPGEVVVTEPDLVLREEPVWIMGYVELSIGAKGVWGRESDTGDVFLDVTLPV